MTQRKGVTGAEIWIDKNGDSEGNFSVLALKRSQFSPKDSNFTCDHHMVTVATFQGRNNNSSLPVSEMNFQKKTHQRRDKKCTSRTSLLEIYLIFLSSFEKERELNNTQKKSNNFFILFI